MNAIRFSPSVAALAIALGSLATMPSVAHGQRFYEVSAGWNFMNSAPASSFDIYSSGINLRGSIGQAVTPRLRVRFDADATLFTFHEQYFPPCPTYGCPHPFYNDYSREVVGMTANGLANLDSRGIFYVIGGAGIHDVYARDNEAHVGASIGAGIAIPLGPRYRAVIEGTWHVLVPTGAGPSRLAPVTIGLRF